MIGIRSLKTMLRKRYDRLRIRFAWNVNVIHIFLLVLRVLGLIGDVALWNIPVYIFVSNNSGKPFVLATCSKVILFCFCLFLVNMCKYFFLVKRNRKAFYLCFVGCLEVE